MAAFQVTTEERPRHSNQSPEKARSIPTITKKTDIVSAINMTHFSLE